MIKVMLIEDEPEIRKLLRKIIEKQEGFTVVAEAESVLEAVKKFTEERADVAFVDIDLNGESGLECAKMLTDISPKIKIIFATAHSEYMANAFEIYAFDYLVKPFNIERVEKTLNRIKGNMQEVAQTTEPPRIEHYKDKLLVKGKEQVTLVDMKDIILIERVENATSIVTSEGCYKTSAALGDIEAKLNPAEFMRSHKSYLINIGKIVQIEPYGRWTYTVKFKGVEETALMTAANYDKLKEMFL
ncbi:MAG: LytR/AlgR family response regulator transcription factor [Roseburia sp.]